MYTGCIIFGKVAVIGVGNGIDQFWSGKRYAGFDYHYKVNEPEKNLFGQVSDKNNIHTAVAGIAYTLPLLFVADANDKFRAQLGREDIPITNRLRLSLMGNTDKEYTAGFRYIITKYFSVSSHYDNDTGLGAGLTLTY
jgi:hypothetical protein